MSGIKRTTTSRATKNEYNLKGITYSDVGDLTNIDNSLNVVGNVTIQSKLKTIGDVSLNAFVDVSDGLNVVGPTTVTTLQASSDVSLNANVEIAEHLLVKGDVSLNKDLYVDGETRLVGTVTIDGSLNVNESSYTYTKRP